MPDPDTRGSLDALLYEMDTHGVDHATVVCARIGAGAGGDGFGNSDNNDYVSAFAREHLDRVTAWIDVDCVWRREYHTPGAAARLGTELDRTGSRGFTHYFGVENDGWLRSDEARQFFRLAAKREVIASLSAGAAWYPDLRQIAKQNPTLPILIHHMSVPRRTGAGYHEGDLAAMLELAEVPNIGVKVSGFNYNSARAWDFPYADARELLLRIYSVFGPGRLFWGSDFPASRAMLTYTQSLEVLRSHCDFLPAADLALILGDNLKRLLADPLIKT